MAPEQLLDLLPKVAAAVAETAAFIRHERKHFSPSDIELKSFNDLVSYVDREAEERLTAACTALMPGSGFIREEGDDLRSEADYRWIIDPLDGTTNFIHDIPAYCISLALQYREETILGIVHDVPRDEVFSAVKRKGAWKNGEPMQVSIAKELGRGLIATGFPYASFDKPDDYLAVIRTFLQNCHGMRRFGAAALDLAWVAAGRLEGFYESGLQAWDVAAGALLVQEAGGTVSDFKGTDNYVFGREIVGSNGHIHTEMLEILRKLS